MRKRTEVDLSRALGGILVTEMFVTTLIPPLFYVNDSIGLSQSGPLAARLGSQSLAHSELFWSSFFSYFISRH
jgi:hypothetical protein